MKLEFSGQIFEKAQIPNFMKVRPVGADLFHVDVQTHRHDEATSPFSQLCEHAKNLSEE